MNHETLEYIFNRAQEEGIDTSNLIDMVWFAFNIKVSQADMISYMNTKRQNAKQQKINNYKSFLENEGYNISK